MAMNSLKNTDLCSRWHVVPLLARCPSCYCTHATGSTPASVTGFPHGVSQAGSEPCPAPPSSIPMLEPARGCSCEESSSSSTNSLMSTSPNNYCSSFASIFLPSLVASLHALVSLRWSLFILTVMTDSQMTGSDSWSRGRGFNPHSSMAMDCRLCTVDCDAGWLICLCHQAV